jgi:PAS domain S-box-containing protein
VFQDIPDDTVFVMRTILGKIKPKSLMVLPIMDGERLLGMLAFVSVYDYAAEEVEMLNMIQYYIGAAVSNGLVFEKTKRLTNELRFQNQLIQNLNDDLENRVRERTGFLRDIIDSLTDCAIYAMDAEYRLVIWNKGAELLYGFTSNEMLAKRAPDFRNGSRDSGIAAALEVPCEKLREAGRFTQRVWRAHRNGARFYAETTWYPRRDEAGDVIGYTNITRDITETGAAEKTKPWPGSGSSLPCWSSE